jgi:hypothetical protein
MIQKIRIARRQISDVEKVLLEIDPHWKSRNLFGWQYGGDNQTDLTPLDVYDLKGFRKRNVGQLMVYDKGRQFVIEKAAPPFTDVLTNIEPSKDDKWTYDPAQKAKKVVLGRDKLI